jgi:hypothetical protein
MRRLADAEHDARAYELPERGDHPAEHLAERPAAQPEGQRQARAQAVGQGAGRQLREGIGPQERRQQQSHIRDGQAQILPDQRIGHRQGGAIDVVDHPGRHQEGERERLDALHARRCDGRHCFPHG